MTENLAEEQYFGKWYFKNSTGIYKTDVVEAAANEMIANSLTDELIKKEKVNKKTKATEKTAEAAREAIRFLDILRRITI